MVARLARLCALLAILVYQPLAALHFAADEAHLAHASVSIQVAHLGHAEQGSHHRADGQPHGHFDELCSFCVLAGVSLPPMPAKASVAAADLQLHAPGFSQSLRAERRLRINHPARAPPQSV